MPRKTKRKPRGPTRADLCAQIDVMQAERVEREAEAERRAHRRVIDEFVERIRIASADIPVGVGLTAAFVTSEGKVSSVILPMGFLKRVTQAIERLSLRGQ